MPIIFEIGPKKKDLRGVVEAYCIIAKDQVAVGDLKGVRDSFKRAETAAANLNYESHRNDALYELALVQIQLGDFVGAKTKLGHSIYSQNGYSHKVWNIVKNQVQNGNLVALLEWIESMEADRFRVYAYLGVADALIQAEKHKK